MKRVEQRVPLKSLDLRTCKAAKRANQFLAGIVVDVQEPLEAAPMAMEEGFNRYGVEFDDRRGSWYWDTDNSEDDGGDDGEG